ncbi:MAG TPA: efflux RND transporter permease subunit [Candidatus Paceibacterota bacterium]|nr:efflux RND transporter permease subunit [Candidatus Paceibacterota bacterium]
MLWLWNFFLEKRQFSYVLIVTLVVAGSFALIQIPKEVEPPINIPEGIVVTALPGANATDIETLVTNKIEDQISGISNIDTMTSVSSNGVSNIAVQFLANANINQSIQDLRDAVAKAVPNLPADATTPSITKVSFSNSPILIASISGDVSPLTLSTIGQTVSDALKRITGVSEVNVAGVPDRQVDVVVDKKALLSYGLQISNVIGAINASNATLPVGSISMDGISYTVNFQGSITDTNAIQNIVVANQNGTLIYVRDVAKVFDGLAPATTYSRLSIGGQPSRNAITFSIYKQSDASIQGVGDAVRQALTDMKGTTLAGLHVYISPATDMGVQVGKQLGELAKTGLETVALVILVLLITIGWRESIVAAISIPLSFLIAFIGLYLTGNSLNFITLFALILAVGILVDSGIVVTEAIHTRMRDNNSALAAAHKALSDYAWPLIAGTMATVAVFVPLFFISGIIGKFIAGIPYTLIFVLMASIFVSLGMVPLIAILFSTQKKNKLEVAQEAYTDRITAWYKNLLRTILTHRHTQKIFLLSLGGLFLLSVSLPLFGLIQTVFLPQSDQDYVFINLTEPEGTTLAVTDNSVRQVENVLYGDSDIYSFQTTIGQSSALSDTLTGSSSGGGNIANITINLPLGHTKTSTQVVNDLQKKLASITTATIQVLQVSGGPPSGAPIQIQFEGNNLNDLVTAADNGEQLLSTIPHVTNLTSSTQNNGTEFDLSIDRSKAATLGVNAVEVAQTLRSALQGTKAISITKPNKNIDVVVMMNVNSDYTDPSNTNQTTIDSIKNLTIQGSNGPVLLGSILSDSLGQSNASIAHKDKVRLETVSAYPDSHTTASAVVATFQNRISSLSLPAGVSVSYGGDAQSINQSFSQMFVALIAGLALMFMILIVAFNSFRYTFYLIMIVPLSLIGVLDGLALTGQPISFSSLLGVIALGGVIINHAIILMDSMIRRLHSTPERPIIDIVIEASATRLRPIVLTTITTVIGMIPLSMSNPTWGPLAFSIMFGLSFAIILTLVLVPVLFYRSPHKI